MNKIIQLDPQKSHQIFLKIRSHVFGGLYDKLINEKKWVGSPENFFRFFEENFKSKDILYWNYSDFLSFYFGKKWGIE